MATLSLAVIDLNHDGVPDIVAGNATGVQILLNKGAGTFGAPKPYIAGGKTLAVADLNGDGNLDILGAGASSLIKPSVRKWRWNF